MKNINKYSFLVLAVGAFIFAYQYYQSTLDFVRIQTERGPLNIKIELADTFEERRLGLMFREELKDGEGMLFVYDRVGDASIWMKNTLIPLDIVFIDEDYMINHIYKSAQPCKEVDDSLCEKYPSTSPIKYILELPGGYSEKMGIRIGDEIKL